ncbi:MAG TPA: LysM peptidoglycan-binding domain-containing protein [Crocinitomix sp.]|nr:LysM peptidoglycan-binding domain-containing protein [Crocinitomix sp.]
MKKLLFLILAVLFSILSFAQPNKADVETVKGKKYYVHFVQKGQTLYAIHQLYDVPVGDIVKANDGLTEGLQIGQKILVPIPLNNSNYYGEHIVKKGETLYGISKQHKCSVEDLKSLNPKLNETAISIGQKLKVPLTTPTIENNVSEEKIITDPLTQQTTTTSFYANDSIIKHTVLAHETLYSISKRYMVSMKSIKELNGLKTSVVKEGDVLKIKVKKVNYEIVENPLDSLQNPTINTNQFVIKKDKYKVALFLPLMLSKNQSYMKKPLTPGQIPTLHPTTKIAADFYHGFILAADSLTQAGLNVEIYVYDTKKDTNQIAKCFSKAEFKNMDLIVGPLFPKTIEYVANYCKIKGINMVIPFKSPTKVLYQNPHVYKATTSNLTLMDGIVDYIVESHAHHHISIYKPSSSSDLALYEKARERYNSKITSYTDAMTPKIQELTLGQRGGRDLMSKLRKDTVNVIIVPSTDLQYVSNVFIRLNNYLNLNPYAKNLKIIVFGLEDWNSQKFKDLDLKHRMRLHQHYASYRYVDYQSEKTKKMMLSYRKKYATDPEIYGIQGFDVGFYFLSALYLKGVTLNHIENYQQKTIQNNFYFPNSSDGNGKENHTVYIVEYKDYELVLKSEIR